MDAWQLREYIVRPALESIDMHSENAEALVMGTAAVESKLQYVRQLGGGPALSIFQIEPETFYDIIENYLKYRAPLSAKIRRAIDTDTMPRADRLIWDMRLATIMCRLKYRRSPLPLPDKNDIWGQAEMWLTVYNAGGKGTLEKYVESYRLVQE